jgi:membrane-associated phospholipid phosphatase
MLFMGFIGSKSLTSHNSLGSIFPPFTGNIPIIILLSLILEYPLFFVGYFYAKKTDDKLLTQRIAGLFIIMFFAFISMRVLKNFFDRPRYRTVVLGYDGISFVPWYTPFSGAEKSASAYGLSADEFRSFPSGHSIFSVLTMCIFPSLTWIFPKLKGKYMPLFFAGLAFGMFVMFTRMILGAHYLSDTSAGAIIGILASVAFGAIQLRISKKNDNT